MAANLTALLEHYRELYFEWYKIFIDNIHMLDLRPNKWLKNGRLPVLNDIVLFVFLDSEYGKGGREWRLGKVSAVKGSQISVTYSVRGAKAKVPPLQTVLRSARDVSILYSAGDLGLGWTLPNRQHLTLHWISGTVDFIGVRNILSPI